MMTDDKDDLLAMYRQLLPILDINFDSEVIWWASADHNFDFWFQVKDISLRIRKIFIDLEKVEKALGKQKSTDNLDTDSIFGDQSFSQNNSLMEDKMKSEMEEPSPDFIK